jgi:hypothetical protein
VVSSSTCAGGNGLGDEAEEVAGGGSCRVSTMSQVCQGGSNEGRRMCSLQKEKLKKCEDTVVVVSEFPGIRRPPFPTSLWPDACIGAHTRSI